MLGVLYLSVLLFFQAHHCILHIHRAIHYYVEAYDRSPSFAPDNKVSCHFHMLCLYLLRSQHSDIESAQAPRAITPTYSVCK